MNLPNLLSLSRVAFLFIIAVLLFLVGVVPGMATLAFVLYIIAAITDWADGWVARRYHMITDFGKLMDALADKVLNVGIFVVIIGMEVILPGWCLFLVLVILTREFLITGLRQVAATRGVVMAAEKSGKIKTVFQIIAAALIIFAEALRYDFSVSNGLYQTAHWAGVVFLVVATGMTLQSGYAYLTRYWHLFDDKPPTPREK